MIFHCCDDRRREQVLASPAHNGIDFIEVLDREAPPGTPRQRTLLLRFLKPAPTLTLDNLELMGGERFTDIAIEWITRADAPDPALIDPLETGLEPYLTSQVPAPDHVLALRTTSSGDHAEYRLRLVNSAGALTPPPGIDRLLAEVAFSFKAECDSDFDCAPATACPEDQAEPPAISYLAKDYTSFRRLMLGRMAQIMPDWRERSPADLGITLVEMLAYTGDRLSYAHDAVATEAYLATARRRSSVRRHARLVDYHMDDGANARCFVHVEVSADGATLRRGQDWFMTRTPGLAPALSPAEGARALDSAPVVFEPLHDQPLFVAHNRLDFYEWGSADCALPRGATRATLAGDYPDLAPGDVLILEERLGPRTGRAADADPAHRHPVRLTAVQAGLTDDLPIPPDAPPAPITEIRWAEEDALPFPLCISATREDAAGGGPVTRVSHALGNVVLADHGRSVAGEALPAVPRPHLALVPDTPGGGCEQPAPVPVPPRYAPALALGPLTQAAISPDPATGAALPYDPQATASAFTALNPDPAHRRPALSLTATGPGTPDAWEVRRDLLNSFPADRHVVAELEADGRTHLRFGDDLNGRRPNSGTAFAASYRVGNGRVGNIGTDALAHVVTTRGEIVAPRNPLPATGGRDPETAEEARRAAPYAYRRQERAVTAEDYATLARRYPGVQRAVATLRWNGYGHTIFVTVDREQGRPVTAAFREGLAAHLDGLRMAGYGLQVDAPRFVALELSLFVCVGPDHFRTEVRREVIAALGTGTLLGGQLALFHPDRLSFGEPVHLSPIYAAVMAVPGVTSVKATRFRRRGGSGDTALKDAVIPIGRLEIARLENDPNFPERGALDLTMGGGK